MADKEETKDAEMKTEETPAAEAAKVETPEPVVHPPLQAAAYRLEKSLKAAAAAATPGSSLDSAATTKTTSQSQQYSYYYYSNPSKIVRRWISTSSGAAQQASEEDIRQAAKVLLKPETTTDYDKLVTADPTTPVAMADGDEATESFLEAAALPVQAWLMTLLVRVYWRRQAYDEALSLAQTAIQLLSKETEGPTGSGPQQQPHLYGLLARTWRWYALVAESSTTATLDQAALARAHNRALLRRDSETAATLLNAMLRHLLLQSQVEQAQKLLSNSTFPETASNNQFCRYLYYSGRIQALRLEYTASYSSLSQSLRKAPTNTGLGFRVAVQQLLLVVQLLMGEVPNRPVFETKGMKAALKPYLHITQAVRRGDLANFQQVVSQHKAVFQENKTYTLISRLAHQVVKAGLRKLQLSYSRLSLQDVADRLGLPSKTSAELVVAKAVRDGVLDATVHHEEEYVQSHDVVNVYYGQQQEPLQALHRRIAYCLTTHNDAVRAMRYPPDAYKKQLEDSRKSQQMGRKKSDKTDEEKAQELEDEMDDEY